MKSSNTTIIQQQQTQGLDEYRQKYAEITKDFLWSCLQYYYVESTEKRISLSAD